MSSTSKADLSQTSNRRIQVFDSSTFGDMIGDRYELMMTNTWLQLRRFCQGRQVELVEADLCWGIVAEQGTRKETLKLCLDEIRACRLFFMGLLGGSDDRMSGGDDFLAAFAAAPKGRAKLPELEKFLAWHEEKPLVLD